MRIRWENILPFFLIILVIILITKLQPALQKMFDAVNEPDYTIYDPYTRYYRLCTLIAIGAIIIGIAKYGKRN